MHPFDSAIGPDLAVLALCSCFYDARNISLPPTPRERNGPVSFTQTGSPFYRNIQIDGPPSFTERPGERRANAFAVARASFLIPDVRAPVLSTFRSLSPGSTDYPGFGHSDCQTRKSSRARSDHIAETVNHSPSSWAIAYTLYMQDYGGPVGFACLGHIRTESRVLSSKMLWRTTKVWRDLEDASGLLGRPLRQRKRSSNQPAVAANDTDAPSRRRSQRERYDPDLWTDEFAFLISPAKSRSERPLLRLPHHVQNYPRWQAWMREKQPRLL